MSKPTETAGVPYIHHRVIHWSDTDAAEIVYTVRFLDYVMEAVEGWWRNVVGTTWFEMNMDRHIGTPVVNINLDFRAPLTPRHRLRLTVLVERAGRAAITFNIRGDRDDGVRSFDARLTACTVDNREQKSITIPSEWRRCIEDYMAHCAASHDLPVSGKNVAAPTAAGDSGKS